MHELSLCQAVADTVRQHAEGQQVERVTVRIGHLRQVVPDALQFSWTMLTDGTDLDGAALVVEHVPAVIRCGPCGASTELDLPIMLCERCGSAEVTVVRGEELLIVSLDRKERVV